MKKILTTTLLGLSLCLSAQAKQNLEYLPTYEQWQDHTQSIMKFWLHKDAKGVPEGNFPTWRCDDGTLRNQKQCKNEKDIDWIKGLTGYDYVRMQARQTFAYGALFNLTGLPTITSLKLTLSVYNGSSNGMSKLRLLTKSHW